MPEELTIEFRRINYGRPPAVSPSAVLLELIPEWPYHPELEDHEITELWESLHIQMWAVGEAAFRFAYRILRAFRTNYQVTIGELPVGLAIGQIPAGKILIIQPEKP